MKKGIERWIRKQTQLMMKTQADYRKADEDNNQRNNLEIAMGIIDSRVTHLETWVQRTREPITEITSEEADPQGKEEITNTEEDSTEDTATGSTGHWKPIATWLVRQGVTHFHTYTLKMW
eukprot:6007461-Amphidinium_carterae.1